MCLYYDASTYNSKVFCYVSMNDCIDRSIFRYLNFTKINIMIKTFSKKHLKMRRNKNKIATQCQLP